MGPQLPHFPRIVPAAEWLFDIARVVAVSVVAVVQAFEC